MGSKQSRSIIGKRTLKNFSVYSLGGFLDYKNYETVICVNQPSIEIFSLVLVVSFQSRAWSFEDC
jgi:hypothetical protein